MGNVPKCQFWSWLITGQIDDPDEREIEDPSIDKIREGDLNDKEDEARQEISKHNSSIPNGNDEVVEGSES